MDFNGYQQSAMLTRLGFTPDKSREHRLMYLALALNGEAGEVAEKVKKFVRDGDWPTNPTDIGRELGDCLWYITALSDELGFRLEDIAALNVEKVTSRQRRSVIHGAGDDR